MLDEKEHSPVLSGNEKILSILTLDHLPPPHLLPHERQQLLRSQALRCHHPSAWHLRHTWMPASAVQLLQAQPAAEEKEVTISTLVSVRKPPRASRKATSRLAIIWPTCFPLISFREKRQFSGEKVGIAHLLIILHRSRAELESHSILPHGLEAYLLVLLD